MQKGGGKVKTLKRYEEAAKKKFGKVKVDSFIMSNATRVSFEVPRERWQEIKQSPDWAAVKKMIEKCKEPDELLV